MSTHCGDMPDKVLISPCSLAVTLTFDLLTLKPDQFILVSNCTEVVNLVKFPQAVYKTSC